MTILGSLGAVTPASQTGDAADVTLTPDAETLALFASLFAMIQPQTRAPEAGMPADPAMQEGDPAAIPPANPEMSQALPAAAMLISGAGKTEGRPLDDQALSDMAPLSHLLTVAKTMTGAETVPQIDDRTPVDADLGEQGPDVTTAKAILVRAIEILDDIDSGQPAAQDSDIEVAPAAAPTGSQPNPSPQPQYRPRQSRLSLKPRRRLILSARCRPPLSGWWLKPRRRLILSARCRPPWPDGG